MPILPQPFTTIPPLPGRTPDANKGDCGRILVVGGSLGMAGAPCLAARAAYRSGAGLVLVAVPKRIWDVVAAKLDECQTKGLGERETAVFPDSSAVEILRLAKWADIVVMGPGMGHLPETVHAIRKVVADCEKPLVLDADALNAFDGGKA
jgi:NAD(P)H-hydrate epimerase